MNLKLWLPLAFMSIIPWGMMLKFAGVEAQIIGVAVQIIGILIMVMNRKKIWN